MGKYDKKTKDDKPRKETPLRDLAKVATGAGLTLYAGKKATNMYRKHLDSRVQKMAAKGTSRLERSSTFKNMKTTFGAIEDTFGENPGIRDFARGLSKKNGNSLEKNIFRRATNTNRNLNSRLPRDISSKHQLLSSSKTQMSREAFRHSMLQDVEKRMNTPEAKNIFGQNSDSVVELLKDQKNERLLHYDYTKTASDKSENPALHQFLINNHYKDEDAMQRTSNLIYNSEEEPTFYKEMEKILADSHAKTKEDVNQFRAMQGNASSKTQDISDNPYAQMMLQGEVSSFHALRTSAEEGANSARANSFRQAGYHQVTLDEALGEKLPGTEDDRTIGDIYSFKRYKQDSQGTENVNVAKEMRQRAIDFGMSEEDAGSLPLSSELYINDKKDSFVDLSSTSRAIDNSAEFIQDRFQVPMLNMNPMDILQNRARMDKKGAPTFNLQKQGEILPFVNQDKLKTTEAFEMRNVKSTSKPIDTTYMFSGDRLLEGTGDYLKSDSPKEAYQSFLDNLDDITIEDNLELRNVRSGLFKRHAEGVSGRTNRPYEEDPSRVKKLFGLGQEKETPVEKLKKTAQKFDDPFYAENVLDTALNPGDFETFEKSINQIHTDLRKNSNPLSNSTENILDDRIVNILNDSYGVDISADDFKSEEGILSATQKLSQQFENSSNPNSKNMSEGIAENLENSLSSTFKYNYGKDEVQFGQSKRFSKRSDELEFNGVAHFKNYEERIVTPPQDLKKNMEQLALTRATDKQGNTLNFGELIKQWSEENVLDDGMVEELSDLDALSKASYFSRKIEHKDTDAISEGLKEFQDYYTTNLPETTRLQASLKKTDPKLGSRPSDPLNEKLLGQSASYSPIRSKFGFIEAYNNRLAESGNSNNIFDMGSSGVDAAFDVTKQLFAGRGSRDSISTATSGAYYMADRLDTAFSNIGLGLNNDLKGDPTSIVFNQWARRIKGPAIAFGYAKYLDGLTGDRISDGLAGMYTNMNLDVHRLNDKLGLTDVKKRMGDIFPYADQITENPAFIGANFATFGALDSNTEEEQKEYYEHGEDPVRKSRYWQIGSNSPFTGEKVEYYRPNWYRRMKSDYKFTDTMYGSESEYWKNNALPTPTHPFAPIRHFITDPYHYEEKHEEDRPYAVTGGFAELQEIPIVGPMLDSGASSILKPRKVNPKLYQSHLEYQKEYNESLIQSYTEANAPGALVSSPGGGVTLHGVETTPIINPGRTSNSDVYNEDGDIDADTIEEYDKQQTESLEYLASGDKNGGAKLGKTRGSGRRQYMQAVATANSGERDGFFARIKNAWEGNTSGTAKETITRMNENMTSAKDFGSTVNLEQLANTEIDQRPSLDDASDLNSMEYQGAPRQVIYNTSEMAGVYGFLAKTGLGFDEDHQDQTLLQSSSQFDSTQRKWWNMNLGGLGGDISEITRRYIPRDPNKEYYNPIKNTQPDWMPGQEYFTDFKHGDPYVKIDDGEMRLPGDSYESLYNVKKDEEGNYSAFDRYRILSDVAPYSDQYRAAKKEVSLLNQNGYLDEEQEDEYREIREQVSTKKKKRRWYDRKFNKDSTAVDKESVHISRVIDQNTFLTEEYPENPIKLAGVGIKQSDTEAVDFIEQFIKPGNKVKVELDKDPLKRSRDDMMETMRGVVFAPNGEEGNWFGLYGVAKGQNLNYALANRFDDVSVKDKGDATSTNALYSKGERTIGKVSEWFVHDLLPSVPIVDIFADKFMQVRSPVEDYEKRLYSKDWRDWAHPIEDWLKPAIHSNTSRNPIISTARGAGLGWLMGRKGKGYAALAGGLIGGTLSSLQTMSDSIDSATGNDDMWLPKRRRKEREIDEYFDKLKYVKYHGLYEQAKEIAKDKEGIDLDVYYEEEDKRGRNVKGLKKYIATKKKWLQINKKSGYGNQELIDKQLDQVKNKTEEIESDRPVEQVGPHTALAARYREEMESTLYAAEDDIDFQKIYRALPNKDKQYFTEFIKASPKERKKIIELVPKNQRRIYQKMFHMDMDEKENLTEYFSDKEVPDKNWEGWQANASLDDYKLKMMEDEGIELTEGNYWDDDEQRVENRDIEPIEMEKSQKMSSLIDSRRLTSALKGQGLNNVQIQMMSTPTDKPSFKSNINIMRDRTQEVNQGLKDRLIDSLT